MKNDIACIMICMPSMSSGRLIVKRGGNVLPIGLALVGGMPDVFMLIKAANIACTVLWYFMKNMIKVTIRRMSHRKAA